MQIKIYFNEKAVYLCDALTAELQAILQHPDAVFVEECSKPAIKSMLHEIEKPEFHAGVLLHTDFDVLRNAFFKHFTPIEAAGGIVQNEEKGLLFIHRLQKWDLPKGKIEAGETPEVAAVREIEEETGVSSLTIQHKIGETYHTYQAYGKHFIKTTHWFYMTTMGQQLLVPQTEEGIEKISWIAPEDIDSALQNTYPSIKDIVAQFFNTP